MGALAVVGGYTGLQAIELQGSVGNFALDCCHVAKSLPSTNPHPLSHSTLIRSHQMAHKVAKRLRIEDTSDIEYDDGMC